MSKVDPERPKSYKYTRRTIIRTIFWGSSLHAVFGDMFLHHVVIDQHFSGVSPQGLVFSPFQVSLLRPPRNRKPRGGSTHPPRTIGGPSLNRGSRSWKASALWRFKKGSEGPEITYIYIYIYIRRTIIRTIYFDLKSGSRTPEVTYIYIHAAPSYAPSFGTLAWM